MPTPQDLIAALWLKNQPKILAHLDLLERAASTVPLPEPLQTEAAATAHKLAGALGMYGYPAATAPARQLEEEFLKPAPDPATLHPLIQRIRETLS